MPHRRPASLILGFALLAWTWTLSAAGDRVTVDFEVSKVRSDGGALVLVVQGTGERARTKWRVRLDDEPRFEVRRGDRGWMTGESDALRSSGPATVGFKGSDEELQALVDRLGKSRGARSARASSRRGGTTV